MSVEKLKSRLEEFICLEGYEVVEIKLEPRGAFDIIKIFIYKEGGLSIKDCTRTSRAVDGLIEEEELTSRDYRLEVSSPGIDRPLVTERDFARNVGKEIELTFKEDENIVKGKLENVSNDHIELTVNKEKISYSLDTVTKGLIVLPW